MARWVILLLKNLITLMLLGSTLISAFSPFRPQPPLPGAQICIELTARFEFRAVDGVRKEIITLNNQFPGPTIRARRGDTLIVRVKNQLRSNHSTSVHFHGIEMHGTPWFDGPEQVAQCPIPFNSHMDYVFKLKQSGTYWYHSHHAWQYVDGFWGLLIVDNTPEVYAYDDELTITLMDWHWATGDVLSHRLDSPRDPTDDTVGNAPVPDSALINGFGNADCLDASQRQFQCNSFATRMATVLSVLRGRTYRIRVVNPSARASFNFSIDHHQLRAIETDGVDTVQVTPVDAVTIWPAQRYSFLVTMDRWWLGGIFRVRADMAMISPLLGVSPDRVARIQPFAVLQYEGAQWPWGFPGSWPWSGGVNYPSEGAGGIWPFNSNGIGTGSEGENRPASSSEWDGLPVWTRQQVSINFTSTGGGTQGRRAPFLAGEGQTRASGLRPSAGDDNDLFELPIEITDDEIDELFREGEQFANSEPTTRQQNFFKYAVCGRTNPAITKNQDAAQIRMRRSDLWFQEPVRNLNPKYLKQEDCRPLAGGSSLQGSFDDGPPTYDQEIVLNATFSRTGANNTGHLRANINRNPYNTSVSEVPAIFRVMEGQEVPPNLNPFYTNKTNQVVQLVINNLNDGPHPWHLHGHTFWVIGTGDKDDGPFNRSNRTHTSRLKNTGVRRDTTHTPERSWTVIRYYIDNPGVWLLHCHIHWHLEIGLAAVFVEDKEKLLHSKIPAEAQRVCHLNGIHINDTIR